MTVYFVSKRGNDNNPGGELEPFETIVKGISVLYPGDTVFIRNGVYSETLEEFPSRVSWNNAINISTYPGDVVTLKPSGIRNVLRFEECSYVDISNLVLDGVNISEHVVHITNGAHHIRLQDTEVKNGFHHSGICVDNDGLVNSDFNEFIRLKVHDNGSDTHDHGMYISTAYNLFDSCDVYNNYAHGINLYQDFDGVQPYDLVNHNIVRYCRVHSNNAGEEGVGTGILLSCGIYNIAHHNLVWDNDRGIQMAYGSDGQVYSNTIYSNDDYGIRVSNNFTDGIVDKNISFDNGVSDYLDQGTDTVDVNNLIGVNLDYFDEGFIDFHLLGASGYK